MTTPKYRRVLLKLSGETLAGQGDCLDGDALASVARQVADAAQKGVQVGLVVGGGNIFRGLRGETRGFDRNAGDQMGMLATMINSLALQTAIEGAGTPCRVMSAIPMPKICEPVIQQKAVRHLGKGRVVIFGAGTGNPFFTTDSAAALRAAEIRADVLLKATKVDGVYAADPVAHPDARRYDSITYREALEQRLGIMDAAAFSLCRENKIPIIVFNFFKERELGRVLAGEPVGTLVHDPETPPHP